MQNKITMHTGNGTVIAIIDTGVDFSNPDIRHSLARDEINHPLMLDPDGQGIILTNATFLHILMKMKLFEIIVNPFQNI